ncbi:MAG: SRPBCC family protein [Solirubrobacterales bacterium]|nr:SRPBCC family protein [Solirubrobacterales bacterium]MBA3583993.1 SRPBCC family protein [Gemmatimonadota bacterium]
MPTTRRSKTFAATPEALWDIVGDAHHMPRWWPRVSRMEGVDAKGFTQVLLTSKGKTVRADFRVLESSRPQVRSWTQELVNTPFERILAEARTEVRLEARGSDTKVTISLRQKLRGLAAFGSFMVRGATKGQLDEALEGLRGLVEP